MSSRPESPNQADPSATQEAPRSHLILPGLLLIALSAGLYLGVHWWFARTELQLLRQELRTTQAALRSAQLRVEADKVIIKHQLEMLRSAQEPASKSSP
jgi:hypothetical protein